MLRKTASLLPVLLAITVACASATSNDESRGERTIPPHAVLNVENHHWLDVIVYVLHGGTRARMGQVTATSVSTFAIPQRMLGGTGQIRLAADPIGSHDAHTSETIFVKPGQRVSWTIGRTLTQSSVMVR